MENEYDWTIMVYMAGDNNLSENMAFALNELEKFRTISKTLDKSRAKVNVLVYFDGSSLTAPTHYIDFSDDTPQKHEITKDNKIHTSKGYNDKKDLSEDNSASAYSVLNFVHWCLETQKRKASNYAMVFSGHSEAFKNTTLMQDDDAGYNLSLWKFRWAMEKIRDEYLDGNKIDILGFDSCVMSMLEVGYELKDVAKTIVASEGSIPNSGWGYASLLNRVVAGFPRIKTDQYIKELASEFVFGFTEHYKSLSLGGRSVDISAWDLEEIDPLAKGVNELAGVLISHLNVVDKIQDESITEDEIAIYQEVKKVILQSHFDAQTYFKEQSVDIKDLCSRLIYESSFYMNSEFKDVFKAIIDKSENVKKAVDNCVLKCGYVGEEYQFSNGISLYFPWTLLTFTMTNYNYRYLRFIKGFVAKPDFDNPEGIGKDWYNFLWLYLSRVTLRTTRKVTDKKMSVEENAKAIRNVLSKDNPRWTKDNPRWSKDNPRWTKDNPPWSKDNPRWSKDNPRWTKGNSENSLFYFAKFKNFQLSWKISGYSDEE